MSGALGATGQAGSIIEAMTVGFEWAKTGTIKFLSVLLLIILIRFVVDQMRA